MLCNTRPLNPRNCLGVLASSLCFLLSACGGGDGTQVASLPPPPATPTPTPTPAPVTLDVKTTWLGSVATQPGTYDLFGRLTLTPGNGGNASSISAVEPGEATITVAKLGAAFEYTLNGSGILPAGSAPIENASPKIAWSATNDPVSPQLFEDDANGKWPQYLGQRLTTYSVQSDGSEEEFEYSDFKRGTSENAASSLTYDIGYSYVAMGEWSSPMSTAGAAQRQSFDLLFVDGIRTPGSGIPTSGTATYDAHTLNLVEGHYGDPGLPFTLTADFGQRTISTQIEQDFSRMTWFGDKENIPGIHVGGSAAFNTSGTFDIPLSGTINLPDGSALGTPPSQAVTGAMNGAFFGPHAEEVGGTFSLQNAAGAQQLQDAFVGQQHH